MNSLKLGLGTVQFGLNYGISNMEGPPSLEEIKNILEKACLNGIRVLDTAAQYGESELALGQATKPSSPFQIVTKTPNFKSVSSISTDEVTYLKNTFQNSLKSLNKSLIYGVLVHHCDDVLKPGGHLLIDALNAIKKLGLVEKIGVSVYHPEEALFVAERWDIDLIQCPMNIFDQRFLQQGCLEFLKKKGIEIHTRSTFLQGLLLMDFDEMPDCFNRYKAHFHEFKMCLEQQRVSALEAALGFSLGVQWVDTVLCGVVSQSQLNEIVVGSSIQLENNIFKELALNDLDILDPSRWRI